MKKANEAIRAACKKNGVLLWEVAEALGMADSNFSRRLRHELNEDEKNHILMLIENVARRRENGKTK